MVIELSSEDLVEHGNSQANLYPGAEAQGRLTDKLCSRADEDYWCETRAMIVNEPVWYIVVPAAEVVEDSANLEFGKWLYFGDKALLHSWLNKLDELVEAGKLRRVKISRKDPRWDPFPHKLCVLCAFTSNDEREKARVKELLNAELGIEVTTWKSDEETERDWAKDGWLRIESRITDLKRRLASGELPDASETRQELRVLHEQWSRLLRDSESSTRSAEAKLSKAQDFMSEVENELGVADFSLATILNYLDRIQTQIARIEDEKVAEFAGLSVQRSRPVRAQYLFVMMPFGAQHVDTYDTIRRSILKVSAELVVERVDERPGGFPILQEIWECIRSARALICDLSDERPNVYYELGYAHALKKPVICVARTGTNIHFDVSGYRVLFFGTYRELEAGLRTEIERILGNR
jgi:hypothetical protein